MRFAQALAFFESWNQLRRHESIWLDGTRCCTKPTFAIIRAKTRDLAFDASQQGGQIRMHYETRIYIADF